MSRSLSAALHGLFGTRPSEAAVSDLRAVQSQQLRDQRLLPHGLAVDACDLTAMRIAVVGGGLAGLYAAWYLQHLGIQLTVFEAAGRLGGRVLTDDQFIPGRVTEAGAEWIGINHPMWNALAGEFGLEPVPITEEKHYEADGLQVRIRFGDHDLDDGEKRGLRDDLDQVFDAIGNDASVVDPVRPWLSPDAEALDQASVDQKLDVICEKLFGPRSGLPRAAMEFLLANDQCAPSTRQSYLGLLALVSAGRFPDPDVPEDPEGLRGYWNVTETHRCGGGNDQLVRRLAEPLTDVRLDTPVTAIVINPGTGRAGGVRVGFGGAEPGSEAFDAVVLSAAPTVWPVIDIRPDFDPAVFTMSEGPAVKHFTRFPDRFWQDSSLAPRALWDLLGSVWESTDRQTEDPGSGEDFGLGVFSGGPHVVREEDYPQRLGEIYPGFAPTSAMFVDWPTTPHILTGYSVPSPGQVCTVGKALSSPFLGRLFFAGEQSCVPFHGYVEGALQSGARAAVDIVNTVCPEALG